MQVVRKGKGTKEEFTNTNPIIVGEAWRENLVDSPHLNFGIVSFAKGARNKLHTHTSDQVLYVTRGTGIVATEREETVVREGDTILIPAGEKHWHGATPESEFAHAVIMKSGGTTSPA
ncbi:MAG: cupin domain-containing protein [Chloroflexi bacterium]|nr:cupin domain-containing protein [Chloroflexota bacterium]